MSTAWPDQSGEHRPDQRHPRLPQGSRRAPSLRELHVREQLGARIQLLRAMQCAPGSADVSALRPRNGSEATMAASSTDHARSPFGSTAAHPRIRLPAPPPARAAGTGSKPRVRCCARCRRGRTQPPGRPARPRSGSPGSRGSPEARRTAQRSRRARRGRARRARRCSSAAGARARARSPPRSRSRSADRATRSRSRRRPSAPTSSRFPPRTHRRRSRRRSRAIASRSSPARRERAPRADDDPGDEGPDDQEEAQDAELPQRLEIERVRVGDEAPQRPVLRPPGFVRSGASPESGRALELVDGRAPLLPAPARACAQQVVATGFSVAFSVFSV